LGYELTIEAPRRVGLREYDERALEPDQVRIATLHSGISAGTEMTLFRGSNPYLNKQWDGAMRLFREGATSLSLPTPAFGYEEVGRVIECGPAATEVAVGDIVWGAWGHRSTHIAKADWARDRLLPRELDPVCGIFGQIGAIALNAVLDSEVHLTETVAVFGQGVPGLMVTQLLKASGAVVVAVDRLPSRLERARAFGADHVLNAGEIDVAEAIRRLTRGRGADVSIEISGAYPALHEAIRATAYNSRVVVSGFFQGDANRLFLGEEFHHNRITLVCSQISGIARGLDHRWDRLRLDRAIMTLQRDGKVDFRSMITHRFPARDLQAAYDLIDTHPEDVGQLVLDFEARVP
jgi:2-desacetyl-2-hydroxyethyl bacteriochlorophyllide A dehydrogenase